LRCAPELSPILRDALLAETWQTRETHLCSAYEAVASLHNALHITDSVPATIVNFFGRPFRVIYAERFAGALLACIIDPDVKRLAAQPLIGGVDQFSDSTDLLSDPRWRPALRTLYAET
jgi:hypothetical protein